MITRMAIPQRTMNTSILVRELYLARVESRLEQECDRTFMSWFTTREEFPGPKWHHVTNPLYQRWQETEKALALLRCV